MKKTLILGMLLLTSTAAAQANSDFDLMGWLRFLGSNPAVLAPVIFGAVSTVKRNTATRYATYDPPRKDPPAEVWWALSALIGVASSLMLYFSNMGASLPLLGLTGWPTSIFYGLTAAAAAVFGRDGLKSAFGWFGSGKIPAVIAVPSPGGLEAIPLLSFPAAGPPQDDPDFPSATRTDWPAVVGDDAPLADQPVNPPPAPAVIVATPAVQESP
ncbi:hypothetical protein [Deinococcus alpinitundrae]|uniref:hypothetical protein n=1 Tax=Deinococcus alpinitundrae TaxID=468913 RepID=UPI001379FDE4|nr:hypothetical protein [Deinococcus alpinitundrae]